MENIEQQDINQKIQDYKEIIASFSELLKTENQALTDFNLELVSSLYEKKLQTVMAYRGLVAYFIKNQALLETINEAEKLDLKNCSQALDELLQENDRLLKTRMENIAKITNKTNATSYGNNGSYTPLDNSRNALAINRTL